MSALSSESAFTCALTRMHDDLDWPLLAVTLSALQLRRLAGEFAARGHDVERAGEHGEVLVSARTRREHPVQIRVASDPLTVGGEVISGTHPAIGMVFQEESTFPWRTVLDNVAFPLEIAGVPNQVRLERAARFVSITAAI